MKLTYEILSSNTKSRNTSFKNLIVEVNGVEVKNEKYFYSYHNLGECTFKQGDEVCVYLRELDGNSNEISTTAVEFSADKNADIEENANLSLRFLKEENDYINTWKVDNDI